MNETNLKRYNDTLKDLERKIGKEIIANDNFSDVYNVETISSGSLVFDNLLGIKGFPKKRIVEIYGNESSGKTSIALQAAKQCLNSGGRVLYIDAENGLNLNYLKILNINTDKLIIANPLYGEQAFIILDAMLKNDLVDLIVIDSVAALIPKAELESKITDQSMGLHARLMSKGLRMIQSSIAKSNTCVIFINQVREKLGVVFGNNEVTTGGRALKFFSSLRIEVRRSELIKNNDQKVIGIKSKINVIKNKMALPFQVGYVDYYFNVGFDQLKEVINLAIDFNIIQKTGSWYSYCETKIGQGKNSVEDYLKINEETYQKITQQVTERLNAN